MIKEIPYKKKDRQLLKHSYQLFVEDNRDSDFYVTNNYNRIYLNNKDGLDVIKNEGENILIYENTFNEVLGVIFTWIAKGGNKERIYIKLNAKNIEVGYDLLTALLWKYKKQILFTKINKESDFVNVFKEQGFWFEGGRGKQILLKRLPWRKKKRELKRRDK